MMPLFVSRESSSCQVVPPVGSVMTAVEPRSAAWIPITMSLRASPSALLIVYVAVPLAAVDVDRIDGGMVPPWGSLAQRASARWPLSVLALATSGTGAILVVSVSVPLSAPALGVPVSGTVNSIWSTQAASLPLGNDSSLV